MNVGHAAITEPSMRALLCQNNGGSGISRSGDNYYGHL
jgi:hypothetical protein